MGLRGPKPKRGEVVWTADFAYAVGLLVSDGSLSIDGRHLFFVSKDKEQIQNLKECLGITANESYKQSGRKGDKNFYYRLQWGDIILYNFLVDIGLIPNKSLTIGALKIPPEFFFDFLRGSFDGDGCFYSYFDPRWKNSFMFYMTFTSGSRGHINWLQESIGRQIGIVGHITEGKVGNGVHNLKYAKKESLQLLSHLYAGKNPRYLSRKKLKIEAALRIVGESLQGGSKKLTK